MFRPCGKAVGKLSGVDKVAVNLLKNSMVVDYDETALSTQNIIDAVTNAGYGASLKNATPKRALKLRQTRRQILLNKNMKALNAA